MNNNNNNNNNSKRNVSNARKVYRMLCLVDDTLRAFVRVTLMRLSFCKKRERVLLMKPCPLPSRLPPLLFLNFFKLEKKKENKNRQNSSFHSQLSLFLSGVLLHRAENALPPLCWAFTKRLAMMTTATTTRATRIAALPSNRNLHRGIIHRTFAHQNSSADRKDIKNDSFPSTFRNNHSSRSKSSTNRNGLGRERAK